MPKRSYSGSAKPTTLFPGITATATSFTVADGTGYPTGGAEGDFVITIDVGRASEEKILCSTRSGNSFTVATSGRGWDGTTAAAHDSQAPVQHTYSATDAREANAHVNDTTGDPHPQYLTVAEGDAAYAPKASVLRLGAPALDPANGATRTTIGGTAFWPALHLADAALQDVVGIFTPTPIDWLTADLVIVWANAGTATGNVRFQPVHHRVSAGGSVNTGAVVPSASTAAAGAQFIVVETILAAGISVGAGYLHARVQRAGNDAADTLTTAAAVLALELRRAS